MKTLAIITTHPIQYNAPFFKLLAGRGIVGVKVFYTWPQAVEGFDDPDFGVKVQWDLPLLEGYDFEMVENVSKQPSSKRYGGIDNPSLIRRIEAYNPDAVLVFGWKLKSHLQVMRHFKGRVPVWFRGDSTLLDYRVRRFADVRRGNLLGDGIALVKYMMRKKLLCWVYSHVDKAFYVGHNNKEYYLEHGLTEERLVYAPHAVDNARFGIEPHGAQQQLLDEWREKLGINSEDFVILYCGKFEYRKNLIFFLKTFLDLYDLSEGKDHRIKFVMFGNGPQEDQLRNISKGNDNVLFMPFQNQGLMPIVYRLGNLFCLPSQSETWGLAINEAMACGRAVLVSDKVGCAVDLAGVEPHVVFESGNASSLRDALLSAYRNRSRVDSQKVKQQISHWSFDAIASAIEGELGEGR